MNPKVAHFIGMTAFGKASTRQKQKKERNESKKATSKQTNNHCSKANSFKPSKHHCVHHTDCCIGSFLLPHVCPLSNLQRFFPVALKQASVWGLKPMANRWSCLLRCRESRSLWTTSVGSSMETEPDTVTNTRYSLPLPPEKTCSYSLV